MGEVATDAELNGLFGPQGTALDSDVLQEMHSMLRLHSVSAQELFYKWESYSIKMGGDDKKLDLKTARDFKKDLQDVLERETRSKMGAWGSEKKGQSGAARSVKASGGDVFGGMLDGIVPRTPRPPMAGVDGNSMKRKSAFDTPGSKTPKTGINSSPNTALKEDVAGGIAFSKRQNAGQILEQLNAHLSKPESDGGPYEEARIKLKANSDLGKFSYKPMAMKLTDVSEILDDRIDEFLECVHQSRNDEEDIWGNPAIQGTNAILAVGRISSDSSESKLNGASVVLETSRRTGAGVRVPLRLESVPSFELFPGKIVAMRGSNPTGDYFTVTEILDLPMLPSAASSIPELDVINARVQGKQEKFNPLNVVISAGPFTADDNLDFQPLHALCQTAQKTAADAIILVGPFLDVEHPLVAQGRFPDLPKEIAANEDTATTIDVFRALISLPLQQLVKQVPSITIILVPSVRDLVNKHVSWPQDRMIRKELGLPKQVSIVTDPVTISLNECLFGISSNDILYQLRQEECTGGKLPAEQQNLLHRLSHQLLEQRHFFPLFPPTPRKNLPRTGINGKSSGDDTDHQLATGPMLDLSYLSLGVMNNVRPDILITPSTLAPFAKVVESVVVINPGTLSKKRGPGTFAQLTLHPRSISDEERARDLPLGHKAFDRTRVDVIRI